MRKTDVEKCRAMLVALSEHGPRGPQHREEILIAPTADTMDAIRFADERDFAVQLLESEARTMRDVRAALDRIREGTYGTCLECDEPIALKRLTAVPWASFCLRCQCVHDSHQTLMAGEPQPSWAD